jgi:rhamnose transport system permease protein
MEDAKRIKPLEIESIRKFKFSDFFKQWEFMLICVFIIINIINISLSKNYLNYNNIMDALIVYMDKALMVFPTAMVILLGEIDISIASTLALSSVLMGVSYRAGVPMPLAVVICLLVGITCGFINGIIIAKFKELSPIIVTLATMILYRGMALMILENGVVKNFPGWFQFLAWGKLGGIPFILIFFIIEVIIFAFMIHRTIFGRYIYAIGNNSIASNFAGINIGKLKMVIFTINGFVASIAGLFFTSKLASTRAFIAQHYELDVIAIVVLGGVSTAGGKGGIAGLVISVFVISSLRYGLGLINITSQHMFIVIGALLIIAVAIPNIKEIINQSRLFSKHKEL